MHQPQLIPCGTIVVSSWDPHMSLPINISCFHSDHFVAHSLDTALGSLLRLSYLFLVTTGLLPSVLPLVSIPTNPTPDTKALGLELHRALCTALLSLLPFPAVISLPDALLQHLLPCLALPLGGHPCSLFTSTYPHSLATTTQLSPTPQVSLEHHVSAPVPNPNPLPQPTPAPGAFTATSICSLSAWSRILLTPF